VACLFVLNKADRKDKTKPCQPLEREHGLPPARGFLDDDSNDHLKQEISQWAIQHAAKH
jgi:hypothetical protein